MHTDCTLDIFDNVTKRIGEEFRSFEDDTCLAFKTMELSRETDARERRELKKKTAAVAAANKATPASHIDHPDSPMILEPGLTPSLVDSAPIVSPLASTAASSSRDATSEQGSSNRAGAEQGRRAGGGKRRKEFSLKTFKFHSLGDYPATIRQFGTTDSYSTEPVSDHDILCLLSVLNKAPH